MGIHYSGWRCRTCKMWAQYIKNDSNIVTIFIKTSTANHYSVSHSPWMGQQSITGLTGLLQRDRQPHTLTSTPTSNSESPIYLTSVSLNCGKKPGLKKRAYAIKEPHYEATPPLCTHKVSAKQLQNSQVIWLLNSALCFLNIWSGCKCTVTTPA